MKLILTLSNVLILSMMSANAQDMQIAVGKKGELILSAKSCEQLLQTKEDLCRWTKKVDPEKIFTEDKITCKNDSKGLGKITISNCLPEFAKNFHQKKLVNEGPNCWGTAMGFHQLFSRPRFMWPEEMMYWMASPLCRKLEPKEAKLPGDIINVFAPEKLDAKERNQRDAGTNFWEALYPNRLTAPTKDNGSGYTGFQRLLHSITYISPELAFGKDSPSQLDRFYFHPLEQTYGRPRNDEPDCQETQEIEAYLREYQNPPKKIKGSKCAYFSEAYRCENFYQHFSKIDLTPENAMTWQNIKELNLLGEKIFLSLVSSTPVLKPQEVTLILTRVDLTIKQSLVDLKTPKLNKNREMLLVMEYFAASGLRQTLEQIKLVK